MKKESLSTDTGMAGPIEDKNELNQYIVLFAENNKIQEYMNYKWACFTK